MMSEESILAQICRIRLAYLKQRVPIKEFVLTRKAFKALKKETASMALFPDRQEQLKHILPGDTHKTIMLRNYKRWFRGAAYGIPLRPALFHERQTFPIAVTIKVEI